jgi:hypothetical protein
MGLDDTARGADFFQGLQIVLPPDGSELLGILLRATATGFGTSTSQPAGHLALGTAVKALREAALANAEGDGWLTAELMLSMQLLQSIGAELEAKYLALIHDGITVPSN